jgi:membrane-associated phospholipid phosphatase
MSELLLVLLAAPFVAFLPLSRRGGRVLSKSWIDTFIPLAPVMILPYLSFFILVPFALIVLVPTHFGTTFLLSIVAGMWAASCVWFFVPTSMLRPAVRGHDVFSKMMRAMYRIDGASNNFPSSHVFISLISGYFLVQAYPTYAAVLWVWVIIVASSTVFVKQHYLLDVVGGIVWAVASVSLAQWFVG